MLSTEINDLDNSSRNLSYYDYYKVLLTHIKKIVFLIKYLI